MPYKILPFRFLRENNEILMTNFVGDHIWVNSNDFDEFVLGKLKESSELFLDLQAMSIIASSDVLTDLKLLATRYLTKKAHLENFTSLHMVVTTLRCNQKCSYCQASAHDDSSANVDMTPETAIKVSKMIMQSPSKYIKVEFQGGEPSLNMGAISVITENILKLNLKSKKDVDFVICSNLYALSDEILDFIRKNNFVVSTSMDGSLEIHNKHRVDHRGMGTHEKFIKNLQRTREYIDDDRIGALMTVSRSSLNYSHEIIDEYVKHGFRNIVFRSLNPYGRAMSGNNELEYSVDEYLQFVKEGLAYLIELNINGVFISEGYTTLLLKRMLLPFSTGFVDLQSPAGFGISGAIYNYDGTIYGCDEGRMLSEMGDKKFMLGTVDDMYKEVFCSDFLKEFLSNTVVESMVGCCDCAFRVWCGADPVRHYATQKDIIGHKALSEHCQKHMGLFKILLGFLKDPESNSAKVLRSWISPTRKIN